MAEKIDPEISKLELEALNDYTLGEKQNIDNAIKSNLPPDWQSMDLNDPRITQNYTTPEFTTAEGMQVRGLLDKDGNATKLGEDYLLLEDRGLLKDGKLTEKGIAFTTPNEDLLNTSKWVEQGYSDAVLDEMLPIYKIKKDAGLLQEDKPKSEDGILLELGKGILGIADAATSVGVVGAVRGRGLKEQAAVGMKVLEGASEGAIQSLANLTEFASPAISGFFEKTGIMSPEEAENMRYKQSLKSELIRRINNEVDTAQVIDALTNTAAASETVLQAREKMGEKDFQNVMNGAYVIGAIPTDWAGLAVTAGMAGLGSVGTIAMDLRQAKNIKQGMIAVNAGKTLLEAKPVVEAAFIDSRAAVTNANKLLDDAFRTGNAEQFSLRSKEVIQASQAAKQAESALANLNVGIENASRFARNSEVAAESVKKLSDYARIGSSATTQVAAQSLDKIADVAVSTNKLLNRVERKLGFGRIPWLMHAAGSMTLGTAYQAYGGLRLSASLGAPLLKKTAQFATAMGEEMLPRTNSSTFWSRVAANEKVGSLGGAVAGLLNNTTPIVKGVASAAKSFPPILAYETINQQGLTPEVMKNAGTYALVFGPFERLIGGKSNWKTKQQNEQFNYREKLKSQSPEKLASFDGIKDNQLKTFISSFDAAYPKVYDWEIKTSGSSKVDPFTNKIEVNVNDRAGFIRAVASHEALHSILFRHQADGAVASLMLGSEGRSGLVRDSRGKLDPEFQQFYENYNKDMVGSGKKPITVEQAAQEFFVDNGAQGFFEDVQSGKLYKASRKTPLQRKVANAFDSVLSAEPIINAMHFKLGGATDSSGRMVMGSGFLANGMRELPEVKSLIKKMYNESAGRPSSKIKQSFEIPESSNPSHYNGKEAINRVNKRFTDNGKPLPNNVLIPDEKGNGIGFLTEEHLAELEKAGVIDNGEFGRAISIQYGFEGNNPFVFVNKPIQQGRSVQFNGATVNRVKPTQWILKNGRLMVEAMDLRQLAENVRRNAKHDIAKKLKMTEADILADIEKSIEIQNSGIATDDYFKSKDPKNWEKRKRFVNSVQGLQTEAQMANNPLLAQMGMTKKTGIYRTFAFDRLDASTRWTGDVAIPYGTNSYYNLRNNLVPEAPKMNRMGEQIKDL
jgi:hypothetical protein